jgi:hypothetical protein
MSPDKGVTHVDTDRYKDTPASLAPSIAVAALGSGQSTIINMRHDKQGLGRFNKQSKDHSKHKYQTNMIPISTTPAMLSKNTKRAQKKFSSLEMDIPPPTRKVRPLPQYELPYY